MAIGWPSPVTQTAAWGSSASGWLKRWPSWLPIALIAAGAFLLNTVYSLAVPPWMGPDEPRHVEYVRLLVEHGRLLTPADAVPSIEEEILRSMDRYNFWRFGLVSQRMYQPGALPTRFDQIWAPGLTHELHQPPFYYLLQLPVALLSREMDVAQQVRLMRLLSALLGTGTVVVAWLTMREAFPDRPALAATVASFVAFLPMHAFIAGIVNNDVLAELWGACLIYALVRGLNRGFSWRLGLAGLALVVLGLLTKLTAAMGPPLLVYAILVDMRRRTGLPTWRQIGAIAIGAGVLLLLTSRSASVLDRLSTVMPATLRSFLAAFDFLQNRPSPEHSVMVSLQQMTTNDILVYAWRWMTMLFETLWARFGWLNVRLHRWHYDAFMILTVLALLGACLVIWEALIEKDQNTARQRSILSFMGVAVILGLLLMVAKTVVEWNPAQVATTHTRFLFPQLIPVAVLFTEGLLRLTPHRLRFLFLAGLVVGLIVLNAICLLRFILPFYAA